MPLNINFQEHDSIYFHLALSYFQELCYTHNHYFWEVYKSSESQYVTHLFKKP